MRSCTKLNSLTSTISVTNHNRSMKIPFIEYADLKSFTPQLPICQQNPENSYTKQYQKHTPSGFCYYIKCFDDLLFSSRPCYFCKRIGRRWCCTKFYKQTWTKYQKGLSHLNKISKWFITSLNREIGNLLAKLAAVYSIANY